MLPLKPVFASRYDAVIRLNLGRHCAVASDILRIQPRAWSLLLRLIYCRGVIHRAQKGMADKAKKENIE